MPDNDRVSIDNLTQAPELSSGDVTAVVHTVNGVKSTYKSTMTLLGTFLNKVLQYSSDLHTSSKTIIGAINEINDGGGGGSAVILYGTSAPTSQQGSDGNLYVQYTEGTGGASDVVDALYVKLDSEWCQISTGGGGGGTAASVSFDDTNVEFEADDVQEAFESIVKTLTWAQYQSLSAAEKNNGTIYYISDRSTPISYNDLSDKPQVNGNTLSGNKSNNDLSIYGKTIEMSTTDPDKVADRITALENYSTTEKVVGKWIDDRPIYEKTISLGNLPNNSQTQVAHNITNLARIISYEGNAYDGNTGTNMPLPYSGNNYVAVAVITTNIFVTTNSDRSGLVGYLTLRYVKST